MYQEEAKGLYYLGKQKLAEGAFGEAVEMLRRAVALNPEHGPTQFELAKALAGAARYDQALAQLDLVLAWAPTHPGGMGLRFDILVLIKRDEEALDWVSAHPSILESRARRVDYAALLHRLGRQEQYEAWCVGLSANEFKRVRKMVFGDLR